MVSPFKEHVAISGIQDQPGYVLFALTRMSDKFTFILYYKQRLKGAVEFSFVHSLLWCVLIPHTLRKSWGENLSTAITTKWNPHVQKSASKDRMSGVEN